MKKEQIQPQKGPEISDNWPKYWTRLPETVKKAGYLLRDKFPDVWASFDIEIVSGDSGGCGFTLPSPVGEGVGAKAKVIFMTGNLDAFYAEWPGVVQSVGEMLKLNDKPSKHLLQLFIFLHEFGHAKKFFTEYLASNDNRSLPEKIKLWKQRRAEELKGLPVPGIDPVQLREFRQKRGTIKQLIEKHPSLGLYLKENNIRTFDELSTRQELAYRNMPQEVAVDQFAIEFIFSNTEQLGLKNLNKYKVVK